MLELCLGKFSDTGKVVYIYVMLQVPQALRPLPENNSMSAAIFFICPAFPSFFDI